MDQTSPAQTPRALPLKRSRAPKPRRVRAGEHADGRGGWQPSAKRCSPIYADKALGGAAMVVTETFHVDDEASRFTIVQPSAFHDRFLPRMSSLCDAIANAGSVAIAQIGHAGRQTTFGANNHAPAGAIADSDGPSRDCEELDLPGIERIIGSFADAAGRAKTAGFQGVEIHAGNGYLINQFLSPSSEPQIGPLRQGPRAIPDRDHRDGGGPESARR